MEYTETTWAEFTEFVDTHKQAIRLMYIERNFTARNVANYYGFKYKPFISKVLFDAFGSKGYSWGGNRVGSGVKAGTKFCSTCKKSIKNCECNE